MKRSQNTVENGENPENPPLKQPKEEIPDEEVVNQKLEDLKLKIEKKRTERIEEDVEIIEIPRKIDGKWSNLPVELKELCMKDLDYQTRFKIAQTCRYERFSALRRHRYHWKSLKIEFVRAENSKNQRCFKFIAEPFDKNALVKEAHLDYNHQSENLRDSRAFSLLFHILKFGRIDTIRLEIGRQWKLANILISGLKSAAPFRFANFWGYAEPERAAIFFLKNCESRIEKIHLFGHRFHAALNSEYWNYASVLAFCTAKHIQLNVRRSIPTLFSTIATKWIKADVEIGTRLVTKNFGLGEHAEHDFCRVFADRIRKTEGKLVRISTRNAKKDIILDAQPRGSFLTMLVISASLDYSENAKIGWETNFGDGNWTWKAIK